MAQVLSWKIWSSFVAFVNLLFGLLRDFCFLSQMCLQFIASRNCLLLPPALLHFRCSCELDLKNYCKRLLGVSLGCVHFFSFFVPLLIFQLFSFSTRRQRARLACYQEPQKNLGVGYYCFHIFRRGVAKFINFFFLPGLRVRANPSRLQVSCWSSLEEGLVLLFKAWSAGWSSTDPATLLPVC